MAKKLYRVILTQAQYAKTHKDLITHDARLDDVFTSDFGDEFDTAVWDDLLLKERRHATAASRNKFAANLQMHNVVPQILYAEYTRMNFRMIFNMGDKERLSGERGIQEVENKAYTVYTSDVITAVNILNGAWDRLTASLVTDCRAFTFMLMMLQQGMRRLALREYDVRTWENTTDGKG